MAASVIRQPTPSPDLEFNAEFTKKILRIPSVPYRCWCVTQTIRIYSSAAIAAKPLVIGCRSTTGSRPVSVNNLIIFRLFIVSLNDPAPSVFRQPGTEAGLCTTDQVMYCSWSAFRKAGDADHPCFDAEDLFDYDRRRRAQWFLKTGGKIRGEEILLKRLPITFAALRRPIKFKRPGGRAILRYNFILARPARRGLCKTACACCTTHIVFIKIFVFRLELIVY